MSDLARRSTLFALAIVLAAATHAAAAVPVEITSFGWDGPDVVITVSDSIASSIDLARSDTADVVINLRRAIIADSLRDRTDVQAGATKGGLALSLPGPDGRTAVLSQRADGATTLRVHGDTELGFALLWRPFTRQIVVHTFTWSTLSYGESQYYQGLIALEQRIDDQAEELLTIAASTGEPRAIAALGSWYARRGVDSLAQRYLSDPRTAEQHSALAAVLLRAGDTAAAERHSGEAAALLAGRKAVGGVRSGPATSLGSRSPEDDEILNARKRNAWLLVGFGLLGLALLGGFLWAASRRRRRRIAIAPGVVNRTTAPRDVAGFRVVAREEEPLPSGHEKPAAEPLEPALPQDTFVDAPAIAEPPAPVDVPPAEVADAADAAEPVDVPEPLPAPTVEAEHVDEPAPPIPPVASTPRSTSPTPWTSAPAHAATPPPAPASLPTPTQVEELQARLRAAELAPRAGEPTIDAARRLNLSRDNVELRRRMEDAAARDRARGQS